MEDVWNLVVEPVAVPSGEAAALDVKALRRTVHQTIRKVSGDLESFSFNTAIAALMGLRNTMKAAKETAVARTGAWSEAVENLLLLLAPFTPHIAEELWHRIGRAESIHRQSWPTWDEAVAAEETITLVVQVNGRVRDRIEVAADIDDPEARRLALLSETVQRFIGGKQIANVVVVPGRLVNVVVR